MRFFVCILIAFFFAPLAFACQPQEAAPSISQKAMAAYRAGKFSEANVLINQIIESGIQNADVWTLKGQCLSEMDQFEEAVACFDKAIAADAENVTALDERMHHNYFKLNAPDKALVDCNRLFELGQKHHFMRARLCDELDIQSQAIADYSVVIENRESKKEVVRSHFYRGSLLSKLNAWDLAVRDGQKAESIMPTFNGKMLQGYNYLKRQEHAKALEQFEKLMETDPDYLWLLRQAECHALLGQFDKAEAALAQSKKQVADNAKRQTDFEETIELVQQIKEGKIPKPDVPVDESLRQEWKTAVHAKDRDKAMQLMFELGRQGDPDCIFLSAEYCVQEKIHHSALAMFSQLVNKTDYKTAEVTFLRSRQLFDLKAYDLAKTEFEKAVALGHTGLDTRSTLGILHLKANEFEKAIEDYTYEISVDPPNANPAAWLQLGIASSCLGDLEQSRKHFETLALKAQPESQLRLIANNSLKSVAKNQQLLNRLVSVSESTEATVLEHFSPKYSAVLDPKPLRRTISLIASKVDFLKLNWMDKETKPVGEFFERTVFTLASGDVLLVHADKQGKLVGLAFGSKGLQWNTYCCARLPESAVPITEQFWPAAFRGDLEKAHRLFAGENQAAFPFEKFEKTLEPVTKYVNSPIKASSVELVSIMPDEASPRVRLHQLMETESSVQVPTTMTFKLDASASRFVRFDLANPPYELFRNDSTRSSEVLKSLLEGDSQSFFDQIEPSWLLAESRTVLTAYQKVLQERLGGFDAIVPETFCEKLFYRKDSQYSETNGKFKTSDGKQIDFRFRFVNRKLRAIEIAPRLTLNWEKEIGDLGHFKELGAKFLTTYINETVDEARKVAKFTEKAISTAALVELQQKTIRDVEKILKVDFERSVFDEESSRWVIHYRLDTEKGPRTGEVEFLFNQFSGRIVRWQIQSPKS